jgi:FkbM family methyltransferase
MFGSLIDWYALRFPFPHRGLKYLLKMVDALGMADRDFEKRTFLGLRFRCRLSDHIERYIFWYAYYEKPETLWLLKNAKRYRQFYDIGANIGYFSLCAAAANPSIEVFSFEPSEFNRTRFQQNLLLNSQLSGRIKILPIALGHARGTASFYQASAENSGMSGMHAIEDHLAKTEVPVSTFDHEVSQWPITLPALVKMDVEGYEWLVLQGMRQTLQSQRPDLLIELDDNHLTNFDTNKQELISWLNSMGYTAYQPDEAGEMIPLSHSDLPISLAYFTCLANA